jgi:glycosyltransferase involved in cell wall biosynthesis
MASLGVPTVVLDEVTGFLSKEGDEKAYADILLRLLKNKELRAKLGKAGKKHIEASHGIKAAAKLISSALEGL